MNGAQITKLKKALSQHQQALKAIAPAVDASSLPDDIATTVAEVLANDSVKAVAGARGIVLDRPSTADGGPRDNPSTSSGSDSCSADAALARRLQQLEQLNQDLLDREKVCAACCEWPSAVGPPHTVRFNNVPRPKATPWSSSTR